jgi:hypothetical protein
LLNQPFFYQPIDTMILGVLSVADLCDFAAALAPRPLFLEALVNGCNRRASREQIEQIYCMARAAYAMSGKSERLRIDVEPDRVDRTVAWLLATLSP